MANSSTKKKAPEAEKPAVGAETARIVPIEEVLAGILKQLAINNRILADIQSKVSPRVSVAGIKAGPFQG